MNSDDWDSDDYYGVEEQRSSVDYDFWSDYAETSIIRRSVTKERKRRPSHEHKWQTKRLREKVQKLETALNYTVLAKGFVSSVSLEYDLGAVAHFDITTSDETLINSLMSAHNRRKELTLTVKVDNG